MKNKKVNYRPRIERIKEGSAQSVLDLDTVLATRLKKTISKEDLKQVEKIKQKRLIQIKKNKEWGNERRSITFKIKKIEKKGKSITKDDWKKIESLNKSYTKIPHFNLKELDNEINILLSRDFNFTIDDGFNDVYYMKSSDLIRDKSPIIKILRKMRKKVIEESKLGIYPKRESVLISKVLPKIDFNIKTIEIGEVTDEIPEYTEIEEETDPPILVEIQGDNVINLI